MDLLTVLSVARIVLITGGLYALRLWYKQAQGKTAGDRQKAAKMREPSRFYRIAG